jgi:hypothetical protein
MEAIGIRAAARSPRCTLSTSAAVSTGAPKNAGIVTSLPGGRWAFRADRRRP